MLQDKNNNSYRLIQWLHHVEDAIVTVLLSSILIFAVFQIISRNFFSSGYIWGDSLLRVLVLWLGLAGAIVATRQSKQINIDVLSQFLSPRNNYYIQKINFIFTASICFIITYFSYQFILLEYNDGSIAFANIPAWITEMIVPLGFFVMGLKYSALTIVKKYSV